MVSVPNAASVPSPTPSGDGWLCTGLHWTDGHPTLVAVDGEREHLRVLTPGHHLALSWTGPRRCVGWWAPGTGRTPCPDGAQIGPSATLAQCTFCQNRDHGLAIARDRIVDDGRTYQLYLAWFAPGMLKIGITAELRGDARLLEQGAIGYTVIATGTLPAARRAELTVSGTGLAKERYRASAKVEAWWQLPDPTGLQAGLQHGRTKALRILADHDLATFPDGPIVDNHAFFGLEDGAPPTYQQIDALADPGALTVTPGRTIGKNIFLTTPAYSHPLLLDLRLLAGRTIAAAAAETPCSGLRFVERRRPVQYDMEALF